MVGDVDPSRNPIIAAIVNVPALGVLSQQGGLSWHRLKRNRKFVDSPLEGTGFELLVAGAVKLVVAPFDAPGCLGTGPQPAERRDRALRE